MVELVPWIFVVVGVAVVVAGVRSLRATSRFQARALQAPGVVTDVRWQRTTRDSRSVGFPVVRFNLPDGRTVEAMSAHGSRPAPAQTGQPVTVLYDPADPTEVRLPGFLGSGHAFGIVAIVIGIGFMVLGTLVGTLFLLVNGLTP